MRNRIKLLLSYILASCLMLCIYSCKDKSTNPAETPDAIKIMSGYGTATSVHVSKKIYSAAPLLPSNATYSAGWWSFSADLPNGQTAQMQMQFQDTLGTVQKFYNPLTTYYVYGKGTASGANGSLDYNFTLTSATLSTSYFVVNGTGTITYKGSTGSINVHDLQIPKLPNFYPSQGTITVVAYGASATITFNGTRFASGTFTYEAVVYDFLIDLDTGQIS